MREHLKYRDNSYFNDTDYFLADSGLNSFYLTRLELYRGNWYPKEHIGYDGGTLYPSGYWYPLHKWYNKGCTQVNMATTTSVNCKVFVGKEVEYKGTGIKGTVTQFLLHNMGVNWYQGQGELKRKYGLPYYWTEPKYLELTQKF